MTVVSLSIPFVKPAKAAGKVKQVYDAITKVYGVVPDYFLVLSRRPRLLESIWRLHQEVILRGSFDEKVRGMIRYEVAKADGCPLCRHGYQDLLRMYGLTDEEIWLLDREIRETKYDEKTKNLLIFAYAVATKPHQEAKTVEAFTRLGLSVDELVGVSTMVHFERALLEIAHSLGVHQE